LRLPPVAITCGVGVREGETRAGSLCYTRHGQNARATIAVPQCPCHIRPAAQVRGLSMRGRGADIGQGEEFLAIGGGGVK
jgi:hypothetical protein